MYRGCVVRYAQPYAERALREVLPINMRPVLRAYWQEAVRDFPAQLPRQDDYLTMRSGDIAVTLIIRNMGTDHNPSLVMVMAREYDDRGMASHDQFTADYATVMSLGAQACVQLAPARSVYDQMLELYTRRF